MRFDRQTKWPGLTWKMMKNRRVVHRFFYVRAFAVARKTGHSVKIEG
jgi:hypothetical protein